MPAIPHVVAPRASRAPRRSTGWWLIALGLIVFPLLLVLGYWYVKASRFNWVIHNGQQLLASARDPATVDAALRQWEAATSNYWQWDRGQLIERLLRSNPHSDLAVRRMLTHLTGVDYGSRKEDWERFADDRKRALKGQDPKVDSKESLRLKQESWRANIGLTNWYTTILPIDENIYIAAQGAGWELPDDPADGVVRVDGRSGASSIFFPIPASEKFPRDLVGISAGDECLFAAVRNGSVYCVERDGQTRWRSAAAGVIVSPPMSLDVNRDGHADVIVCSANARVSCLSGTTGKSLWTTPLGSAADIEPTHFPAVITPQVYVVAALGQVSGGAAPQIILTAGSGHIFVINATDGKLVWRHNGSYGFAGGGVFFSDRTGDRGEFYACDFQGQVWSIEKGGRDLNAVMRGYSPLPPEGGVAASLRLAPQGAQLLGGWLLASGGDDEHDGRIALLGTPDRDWSLAAAGMLPTTPAVADVNGDGNAEIVLAPWPRSTTAQVPSLEILSATGHLIHRQKMGDRITAAPVVADVDGDGKLDILVATQGGVLYCYQTRQSGAIYWGLVGGDSRNTNNARNAYEFAQTPTGYQWRWKPKNP